jgi:hypothetical protein
MAAANPPRPDPAAARPGAPRPKDELRRIAAGFCAFLAHRGAPAPAPPGEKELAAGLQQTRLIVASGVPARPGAIVGGVRHLRRPLIGLFLTTSNEAGGGVPKTLLEAGVAAAVRARKPDAPGGPADIAVLGRPAALKSHLRAELVALSRKLGVQVRYLPYAFFCAGVLPDHDIARAAQHLVLTPEEADHERAAYYVTNPRAAFSPVFATDGLCVWAGVEPEDLVRIAGGTSGAPCGHVRVAV